MIVKRLDRLSSKHYLIAILAFLFVLDGLALWFAAKLDHDRTLENVRESYWRKHLYHWKKG